MNEPGCVEQAAQRSDMALGEIDHVDIVAHAGAVGRVVVVAEDLQPRALADRDLRHVRHQVVRDAARILADRPLSCAPTGLK